MTLVHRAHLYSLAHEKTLLKKNDYEFLRRFLDATKANLFFARGVAIVEGPAEALLLPALAKACGMSFSKHGVAVAYPHFIGTIHGFVDRFLALPALRSLGLTVDVIDDDIFAKKAIARAMKMPSLWGWAQNDEGVKPLVGGLVYRGADLVLDSEGGTLPKTTAKS